MKILFVSIPENPAHLIPLIVLNGMAKKKGHSTEFLLSRKDKLAHKDTLEQLGVQASVVDYSNSISTEIAAYWQFEPDVVIDDFSLTTCYSVKLKPTPRISVLRTGTFPGYKPKKKHNSHSSGFEPVMDVLTYGLQPLNNVKDLFKADAYIVPGVCSIEIPPDLAANQSKYYFSGPLIMDDYAVEDSLKNFTEKNRERTIVYLTYGLAHKPPAQIVSCLTYLLEKNTAVITNVRNDSLRNAFLDTLYYSPFLPMHYVCQAADVIIHHCGCGAYHYPILHEKPWITLGTMRYDREDVALKLEELGLSTHLPAPEEEENFIERFQNIIEGILGENGRQRGERMNKIMRIKCEITKAQQAFDIDLVLSAAMENFKP